jgi:hypothetical protein
MLTIDAARALGLDDQVGSLEPGKRADLVVIDIDTPRHQPYSNFPSVLMNTVSAGDIETVVVDGEVLIEDRSVKSIDVESVRTAATQERERLQTRTGWETSLAGSTPPDKSILRRVSAQPLFVTRHGRLSRTRGRTIAYQYSRLCVYTDECRHDRDLETCDALQTSRVHECPSVLSSHPIRRGSITHHLWADTRKEIVGSRMDLEMDVLEQHYDQRTPEEKVNQRRQYLPDK